DNVVAYKLVANDSAFDEYSVHMTIGDDERKAAAHLDDGEEAPTIQNMPQDSVAVLAKVIGPVGETHAKDMSLVTVAGALFFRKVAVVLGQPLSRAVVELYTTKGLAVGVEGVKSQMVAHPHRT